MRALIVLLMLASCMAAPVPPPTVVRPVHRPTQVEAPRAHCPSAEQHGPEDDISSHLHRIEDKLDALQKCLK